MLWWKVGGGGREEVCKKLITTTPIKTTLYLCLCDLLTTFPSLPFPNGNVMVWSFIHSTQQHSSILNDMLNKNNYCWENQVE